MSTHTTRSKIPRIAITCSAIATALIMQACRSKDNDAVQSEAQTEKIQAFSKSSLSQNQDQNKNQAQSSLLSSQASSPVQWQNWHKDLLHHAASEKKTIFAVVGSGTDPCTLEVLDRINQAPSVCSLLNNHHINVLIDSNLHPDLEFLAASICLRSQTAASSPTLVWFSYEGNPISWSPVGPGLTNNIAELVERMSQTVHTMWIEDPEYVLQHSSNDFQKHLGLAEPKPIREEDYTPAIILNAIRSSVALFDPTSNTIDGIGNLNTARYIELVLRASQHADLSKSQRDRYLRIASLITDHLIIQGLTDPLDGGVHSGVQYSTTALPKFSKTLRVQSLTMRALYGLYQSTGDGRYLEAADAIMEYTQKNLSLDDGGYALGLTYLSDKKGNNPCIWKLEEIKAALTEKEFQIASIAFGLKELGNIPFVDNPQHLSSNKNSLTWKLNKVELASKTSMNPASLEQALKSITDKLAKLRSEKPSQPFVEKLETPGSTALLASAFVSAYRATGNPNHLEQATKILNHLRSRFIDQEGNLHRAYFKGSLESDLATGAGHALFCQAAIDLHEVTLDPSWLELAYDLHSRMNQLLANSDNHHIMEHDGASYPQTYDVKFYITLHALDNDNTWALAHANAKRLALRRVDDALTSQWNHLESYMLQASLSAPTSCIDFLTYKCLEQGKKVYIKAPVAPELLATACRQSCQIIALAEEGSYDELGADVSKIPPGTAVVTARGNKIGSASSPAELEALLK